MAGRLLHVELGDAYPLLKNATADRSRRCRPKEEAQFEVTLDQGMKILSEAIAAMEGTEIPGEVVFQLYDTYGFPTDLTADIARERDLTLDMEGFEVAMAAQRERARAASKFSAADMGHFELDSVTEFNGYESLSGTSQVIALFAAEKPVRQVEAGEDAIVVLDHTPFYAESGGQVGDTGKLFGNGRTFDVLDTQKVNAAHLHQGTVLEGTIAIGDELETRRGSPPAGGDPAQPLGDAPATRRAQRGAGGSRQSAGLAR
ncbi:MAG: alanine--tRNA ligase-related protein [Gammaproteobacteria bacterium]|nr:alanine--tRNA ligase-related protein [Gammaproteobacteria bacterium]